MPLEFLVIRNDLAQGVIQTQTEEEYIQGNNLTCVPYFLVELM